MTFIPDFPDLFPIFSLLQLLQLLSIFIRNTRAQKENLVELSLKPRHLRSFCMKPFVKTEAGNI